MTTPTGENLQRFATAMLRLGLATVVTTGCLVERPAEGHCVNRDGDAFCMRWHGDARPFCARDFCEDGAGVHDGCIDTRPSDPACYSPCGEGKSLDEDPGCEGVADGSSSSATLGTSDITGDPTGEPTSAGTMGSMSASGSETEGSSSTSGGGCMASSECPDAEAPICVDQACVPCSSDDECAAKDAGMPACREDGQCVGCTPSNASACEGTTPVCNAGTNVCEGCGYHEQCEGTACDVESGACFEGCVHEVDGDGGAEFDEIGEAIEDGCVIVVHELAGGDSYSQVVVDGVRVAIVAAAGERPIVQGLGGNPSLLVENDAVAYVEGLRFTDADAEGVHVDGAALWLDRTEVAQNAGGGVVLTGGASGVVRNCFVGGAGDVVSLDVQGNTSAQVVYSTIAGGTGDATALACGVAADVEVRNSVLVGRGGPALDILCDADLTYSATEVLQRGIGNVALGELTSGNQNTWFVNYLSGDFHLNNPPMALLSAAQWQSGHPSIDIDGDLRPTEDGAPDVAGADIP